MRVQCALACVWILACRGGVQEGAPPQAPSQAVDAAPPEEGAVRYHVTVERPSSHYVDVEATYPTRGLRDPELMLPVWTPGSYLVRDYSRHIEALRVAGPNGQTLALSRPSKNRWRVTGEHEHLRVRYRVYCREMSVRTNWLDDEFGLLNGAATFVTLALPGERPHRVSFTLPEAWRAFSGMDTQQDVAGQRVLVARDYDELVDSPILLGQPAVHAFDVDGRAYELLNVGEDGLWDVERSVRDLRKIIGVVTAFWGDVPYKRYTIINILNGQRGGLEHRNSTVLMASAWATRDEDEYRDWLAVVAHELFHVWNVKRLRPVALGPFDYEREVYTDGLWIAEGLTAYYDELLLARAGLTPEEALLKRISKAVQALQGAPGRAVRSLEQSSFDAWIRFYRPDENSVNANVSYYVKGGIVGMLLDAKLRAASSDRRSLDDVMRLAYARYAGGKGYTAEEFLGVVREVGGDAVARWLHDVVSSTQELSYGEALAWWGLRFGPDASGKPSEAKPWLGAKVELKNGRHVVTEVVAGGPAWGGGLNVDDELVALGGRRLPAEDIAKRLDYYKPGDRIKALLARRERLLERELVLGGKSDDEWRLSVHPRSSGTQRLRRERWLGPRAD